MPKRGAFALGLTALALALLLNFQVPSDAVQVGRPNGGGAGGPGGSQPNGAVGGGAANGAGDGAGTGGTNGADSTNGANGTNRANGTGGGAGSGTTDPSGGSGQRTFTGPVVDTRFGPVQVELTVSASQVVDVTAVELPSGGRSGQISRFVEPILHTEALQAQSANIDGVSGATYTSIAYARSLQAALDSAGI